ncbi:MAG TPA: prepilin-type N-terminal cleavage/methylation domain-containing protein [Candidatus Ozemobacteraceae bacterium]|nr:prepilin-type N-terminal cleavage/methylation domain-containing protein [Candidatus Ozemobacteraceae bacterium]HQG27369.1 prepilin-type N-terminal cleavage/methylation domain-containing protein [Candidatus Ozemobacteraceae bacterium]
MSSNPASNRIPDIRTPIPKGGRGFTMIELVVVVLVLTLVAGAYFYVWRQQGRLSASDQDVAAYYMAAASFMDVFYSDTRMARRIEPTTDGCIMEVMTSGGLQQVTYTLRDNGIERLMSGKTKVYTFGKPLRENAKVLFRVRELAP